MIYHGKIALRAMDATEINTITAIVTDPAVADTMEPGFIEATATTLPALLTRTNAGTDVKVFTILNMEENSYKPVGMVILKDIDWINRSAFIGNMGIAPAFQCKGIGLQALHALCKYSFNMLGLRKLHSAAYSDNEATAKMAKHLGAQQEGVIRKASLRHGEYVDRIVFGLLREEYRGSGS